MSEDISGLYSSSKAVIRISARVSPKGDPIDIPSVC